MHTEETPSVYVRSYEITFDWSIQGSEHEWSYSGDATVQYQVHHRQQQQNETNQFKFQKEWSPFPCFFTL